MMVTVAPAPAATTYTPPNPLLPTLTNTQVDVCDRIPPAQTNIWKNSAYIPLVTDSLHYILPRTLFNLNRAHPRDQMGECA